MWAQKYIQNMVISSLQNWYMSKVGANRLGEIGCGKASSFFYKFAKKVCCCSYCHKMWRWPGPKRQATFFVSLWPDNFCRKVSPPKRLLYTVDERIFERQTFQWSFYCFWARMCWRGVSPIIMIMMISLISFTSDISPLFLRGIKILYDAASNSLGIPWMQQQHFMAPW